MTTLSSSAPCEFATTDVCTFVEVGDRRRPLVVECLPELDVLLDRALVEDQLPAKRLVLRAQLLVLVLRVDEPAEPADRVGERPRDPVGGDLERPEDGRPRPLHAVERGRAERDRDQDE